MVKTYGRRFKGRIDPEANFSWQLKTSVYKIATGLVEIERIDWRYFPKDVPCLYWGRDEGRRERKSGTSKNPES